MLFHYSDQVWWTFRKRISRIPHWTKQLHFSCNSTIADLTYFYFPHLKGSRADFKGKTMAVFECSEVSGTQNLVSQEMCRLVSLILSHGCDGKGVHFRCRSRKEALSKQNRHHIKKFCLFGYTKDLFWKTSHHDLEPFWKSIHGLCHTMQWSENGKITHALG